MNILLAIAAMAIVTYLIRFAPFILLKKPIEKPFIRRFLYYIPYSVLAAMTFPAIFYSTDNPVAAVLATALALILAFFECSLIVIALCAVAAAFLLLLIL